METFTLNKNNPNKEFKFNASHSYLRIITISLNQNENSKSSWTELIATFHLKITIKYIVHEDSENRFTDSRQVEFPIHLHLAPNQIQPVFEINQLIKNETFKIGQSDEEKFYTDVKIELVEKEILNENFDLKFEVEKFKTA